MPPVQPMLAKSVKGIPDPAKHGGLSFEPKWDGFRCIVFRDGDEVELASRNTKPLTRYFPEVVAAVREQLPRAVRARRRAVRGAADRRRRRAPGVRDAPGADPPGDVAGRHAGGEDARRVRRLRPARARRRRRTSTGRSPSAGRRWRRRWPGSTGPCYLTRTTTDPAEAEDWFTRVRGRRPRRGGRQAAGRDVPAERPHDAEDQARAHRRRGGRRLPRAQDVDAGAAAARQPAARAVRRRQAAARRRQRALHREAPRRADRRSCSRWSCPIEEHPWGEWQEWAIANPDRVPGTQSRWSRARTCRSRRCGPSWCSRSKYDHMEGRRFRHTAQFKRWRPDRDPESCGYEQLEEPVGYDLG